MRLKIAKVRLCCFDSNNIPSSIWMEYRVKYCFIKYSTIGLRRMNNSVSFCMVNVYVRILKIHERVSRWYERFHFVMFYLLSKLNIISPICNVKIRVVVHISEIMFILKLPHKGSIWVPFVILQNLIKSRLALTCFHICVIYFCWAIKRLPATPLITQIR